MQRLSVPLQRTTEGPAARHFISLSETGRFVAFSSNQSGRPNIWIRDLETGKESSLVSSIVAALSRYESFRLQGGVFGERERTARYSMSPLRVAQQEKVCEGCLTDWTRDEQKVMVFAGKSKSGDFS